MLVLYVGLSIYYIHNSFQALNEFVKNKKGGQVMNTEMKTSIDSIEIIENQKTDRDKTKQAFLTQLEY